MGSIFDTSRSDAAERIAHDLDALTRVLSGIEERLAKGGARVAEADGRLRRELDGLRSEVDIVILSLRDDVAAALAHHDTVVERRLSEFELKLCARLGTGRGHGD